MAATGGGMGKFYMVLALVLAVGGFLLWRSMGGGPVSIPVNVTVMPSDTAGFAGYALGPADAPVVIREYADYMCPHCQNFDVMQFPTVKSRLIETGKVRWIFRDYPIQGNPHSRTAAHATACADDQGKYWEMHAKVFAEQGRWARSARPDRMFRDYAEGLGLDVGAYTTCMRDAVHAGRIQASYDEGNRAGVGSTPTFIIGNRLYPGNMSSDEFQRIVDSLIAE
jgi:protein-disulfide isomerase